MVNGFFLRIRIISCNLIGTFDIVKIRLVHVIMAAFKDQERKIDPDNHKQQPLECRSQSEIIFDLTRVWIMAWIVELDLSE